jgi:hypothetical protein
MGVRECACSGGGVVGGIGVNDPILQLAGTKESRLGSPGAGVGTGLAVAATCRREVRRR